jgi:hypothetical protein
MVEALTRVSKLFTKIASAKKEAAKAREQRNRLRANLSAQIATHLPRVAVPPPRVDVPVPRVTKATQAYCPVAQTVANTSVTQPVVQAPTTCSFSQSLRVNTQPPVARPNYILQDEEDNNPPPEQITRSAAWSIMQEAMLTRINIYHPEYTISKDLGLLNYTLNPIKPMAKFTVMPHQMSIRCLPMTWFCEMANSVIGEGSKLLEYKPLIANPKTQAKWTHSYGNEIGCNAQGMPGHNTSTNTTIIFIRKEQVPKERAKDMTYGLITCLV